MPSLSAQAVWRKEGSGWSGVSEPGDSRVSVYNFVPWAASPKYKTVPKAGYSGYIFVPRAAGPF